MKRFRSSALVFIVLLGVVALITACAGGDISQDEFDDLAADVTAAEADVAAAQADVTAAQADLAAAEADIQTIKASLVLGELAFADVQSDIDAAEADIVSLEEGALASPHITLATPYVLASGGDLIVLGSGFGADERVRIDVITTFSGDEVTSGATAFILGVATADVKGSFNETLSIQDQFPAGVYTVQATGDQGSLATAALVTASLLK